MKSVSGKPSSNRRKVAAKGKPGRKPTPRPATARRKNLRLDQRKLDFLRRSLGAASDQEAVERVIDEAVADRKLIAATVALGGTIQDMVDIGDER